MLQSNNKKNTVFTKPNGDSNNYLTYIRQCYFSIFIKELPVKSKDIIDLKMVSYIGENNVAEHSFQQKVVDMTHRTVLI